ncbi:NADH dehydrogenase [ubiquinone] 1 subunit C2 [Pseudolycoriella hygida]|uniref:NADH dehydrogenase [ubiquinone] 1 subunit C2 n=1 Tax=Pseudolycoriella hygida TaxID=35572 RepID=A0A9Q0NH29_9DIPT|nr:NADH dehydrogenase [ubiquinone] 1 subunit C2 [Pseudolycoriella hygida]
MMKMPATWDELFEGEAERPKTFLHDIAAPLITGGLGFGLACFLNFATRRPLFSGIQKHILYAGIGAVGGKVAEGWRSEFFAERDAMIRHYISLHPEDFPMPERKKYADILEEWVPVR